MQRLLRELDHADIRRGPSLGRRVRRTVGRREGLMAMLITGGTIAAVVVVGPVWADESGPRHAVDEPPRSADGLASALTPPAEAVTPVRILPPVAWSDDEEIPELGDASGYGGSVSVSMDKTRFRYISGFVILDRDDFADILYEYYDRAGAKSIVLHEFGHLVGLDHVEDSDEVMSESSLPPTFGPGDRQGLAILGSGPCFPNS